VAYFTAYTNEVCFVIPISISKVGSFKKYIAAKSVVDVVVEGAVSLTYQFVYR